MRLRLQLVFESDGGEVQAVEDVARIERTPTPRPEEIGLTLEEARGLLGQTQEAMVRQQAVEYVAQRESCRDCGRSLPQKGQHEIVYRTLFGKLHLASPRLYHCGCGRPGQSEPRRSFSPLVDLFPERTAPQLAYLETKFAALMSYGLSIELLGEVLPIGDDLNTTAVRRLVHRTADRAESELGDEQPFFIEGCQRDWNQLPPPAPRLTVGLDGGYVHAKDQPSRTEGWFEVIVGKSMPTEGESKCLALVPTYDKKPKRRLFELLKSQPRGTAKAGH